MKMRIFLVCNGLLAILLSCVSAQAAELTLRYRSEKGVRALKSYSLADLRRLKRTTISDKKGRFQGVRLDLLLEDALEPLASDERARVDLLVLVTGAGERVQMPRSFTVKYALVIADTLDGKPLPAASGPLASVLPAKPAEIARMEEEKLPYARFALSGVREIWLLNYTDFYAPLSLKKRTEPLQLRGEKLFVQTCMGCHASVASWKLEKGGEEGFQPKLATPTHPPVSGMPTMGERDRRALESYFRSHAPSRN